MSFPYDNQAPGQQPWPGQTLPPGMYQQGHGQQAPGQGAYYPPHPQAQHQQQGHGEQSPGQGAYHSPHPQAQHQQAQPTFQIHSGLQGPQIQQERMFPSTYSPQSHSSDGIGQARIFGDNASQSAYHQFDNRPPSQPYRLDAENPFMPQRPQQPNPPPSGSSASSRAYSGGSLNTRQQFGQLQFGQLDSITRCDLYLAHYVRRLTEASSKGYTFPLPSADLSRFVLKPAQMAAIENSPVHLQAFRELDRVFGSVILTPRFPHEADRQTVNNASARPGILNENNYTPVGSEASRLVYGGLGSREGQAMSNNPNDNVVSKKSGADKEVELRKEPE